MIDDEEFKRIIEESMKNDFWRDIYENAPSELSKRHIELGLVYGFCLDTIIDKFTDMQYGYRSDTA